jgi:hypothetical protein
VYSSPLASAVPIAPRDLGQQVATAAGGLPQFRRPGGPLSLGQAAEPGMPVSHSRQAGGKQPVTVGSGAIMSHLAGIEHVYDKNKLANPILRLKGIWPSSRRMAPDRWHCIVCDHG